MLQQNTMEIVKSEDIYDLVIIGGGPHALAILSRLYEPRPSSLYTDAESARLSFLRRYRTASKSLASKADAARKLRVLVIDKTDSQWMASWHRLFELYKIKHLRSPMFFHPDPSDLDALLAYSHGKGCDCDDIEIHGVVGKEVSKHRQKKKQKTPSLRSDFNERDRQDYFNPSTKTFREFCDRIVERYDLKEVLVKGEVTDISYDLIHEKHFGPLAKHFCLCTKRRTEKVYGKIVVLAPGVGGMPSIPQQLDGNLCLKAWCHSSQLENAKIFYADRASLANKSIVIIGGGLTSAQIADLAIARGFKHVTLLMRSSYKVKHFDFDLCWLGKIGNIFKMQFYQSGFDERAEIIRKARNGGSITPRYTKILRDHEKSGRLQILTQTQLEAAKWCPTTSKWLLTVKKQKCPPSEDIAISQIDDIDYIVSATGSKPDFQNLPYMRSVIDKYPIASSSGLPHITEDLQYNSDLPLFVASGYAALQLGPGSFNLSGSREAADRIANRVHEIAGSLDLGLPGSESPTRERIAGNECNYYEVLSAA